MPPSASSRRWLTALWGLGGVLALADATRRAWVSDDAFIAFRYARNLVRGHGLVFNVGERVEGYTNLLWTLGTAGAMSLGADPVRATLTGGVVLFAVLLFLLARTSHRISTVPTGLATLAVAATLHMRVFATGGLETMAFTLLVTASVIAAIQARTSKGAVVVGILGTMAALTRPEGALVYALSAASLLIGGGPRLLIAAVLPGLTLLLPALAIKAAWYGSWVPNTFVAKGAQGAHWARGLFYLRTFFGMYVVLAGAPLVATGLLMRRPRGRGWSGPRAPALLAGLLWAWLLYVARVGGDFMFARFLVPVVPAMALALELGLARLGRARWWLGLAMILSLLIAPYPRQILRADDQIGWDGVVEEPSWYPAAQVAEARRQGAVLRPLFQGLDVRVVFYGTQAMLMYYADVPYALEGHVGLTDAELARRPLISDAHRAGHGKKADLAYLRSRDIDLALSFRLHQPVTDLNRAVLAPGVEARVITWRAPVMEPLRHRGAQIIDFPAFLDAYIAALPQLDDAKVAREYTSFRAFYFDHNDDPLRQRAFDERLAGVDQSAHEVTP